MEKLKKTEKLPEGWKRVKLGEVAEITTGATNVQDAVDDGIYPLFDRSTEIKRSNKFLFDKEAVIVPGEGAEFVPKYFKGKFDLHQRAYAIFNFKNISAKYFYYCIHHFRYQLFTASVGTTVISLRLPHFLNFVFICPKSPSEQRKIAEILETVDNAIEKSDRLIEKYKRIKQGLMQDLLTKGIDENGQIRNELTHKFKDSPLGRIPEEWEVVKLEEVVDIFLSNVDKKIFPNEIKVNLCNYLEVYQNEYITSKINFSKGSVNKREFQKFKVNKGDVIITKDSETFDDIAKPTYVQDEIPNLVCGYHLCLLKPKKINGLFLTKVLIQDNFNKHFQRLANGITRFGITSETIHTAKIPLPPLNEQQRIASILSQIDETIEKETAYKEKLMKLKSGLMEDLLTGKVRVNKLINEESEANELIKYSVNEEIHSSKEI